MKPKMQLDWAMFGPTRETLETGRGVSLSDLQPVFDDGNHRVRPQNPWRCFRQSAIFRYLGRYLT